MSVECSSVELYEDGSRNWRRAYYRTFEGTRKQMLREREQGSTATYVAHGEVWRVVDLTDEEIDDVARRYAERITEAAIRQHESEMIEHRVKGRRGQAL